MTAFRTWPYPAQKTLLDRGADIHTTFSDPRYTNEKSSVLHVIGESYILYRRNNHDLEAGEKRELQTELIQVLIDRGADLYAEETMGQNPLEYWKTNDSDIYEILQPYYEKEV